MVALIVFSGPGDRADGIAAYMRALGWRVVEIDILVGGAAHDMANPSTAATLIARVATGEFAVVFLAPPCSSYSVAHRPKLRSAGRRHAHPGGMGRLPGQAQSHDGSSLRHCERGTLERGARHDGKSSRQRHV